MLLNDCISPQVLRRAISMGKKCAIDNKQITITKNMKKFEFLLSIILITLKIMPYIVNIKNSQNYYSKKLKYRIYA